MDKLVEFYRAAAKYGPIGAHVVFTTGTCVCVDVAENWAEMTPDDIIPAAESAILMHFSDRVPVQMDADYYIVSFVGTSIHCIVAADSAPTAAALAEDALRNDREEKKVLAVIWPNGAMDVADEL